MRINHNIAALNTHRQLGIANNAQLKSMEKLSSGLRINRAGDDAQVFLSLKKCVAKFAVYKWLLKTHKMVSQ